MPTSTIPSLLGNIVRRMERTATYWKARMPDDPHHLTDATIAFAQGIERIWRNDRDVGLALIARANMLVECYLSSRKN